MAVPSSGELKLWNSIWNPEIGGSKGDNSLHSASVYAGFSTPDAMSDFYGWSDVEAPTVSTSGASSVTQSSMTANGNVSNTGGENVSRGFYFGTSTTYTSNTKYTLSGTQGTGGFNRSMTGLSAGTTYYINAWASNSGGETVGNQVSQTTYVSFSPSVFSSSRVAYFHGYIVTPALSGTGYAQYSDPNVGWVTTQSCAFTPSFHQTCVERCQYNNTTNRGYIGITYPSGTCPSAPCGQTSNTRYVCAFASPYSNCNVCAHGGGSRTGDFGVTIGCSGNHVGWAAGGNRHYVVHPIHWADRINSAHAVHYETASSDITLKTNISYL